MALRDPLDIARNLKHWLWLAKRATGQKLADTGFAVHDHLTKYEFDPSRYPLSFVALPTHDAPTPTSRVPDHIFVVWSGTNEMSPGRRAGLESMRRSNPDREIRLVTPENLDEFIIDGFPLHRSYENLSLVHKSDYLHSYLLHHHGGGYSGLKPHPTAWRRGFEELRSDPNAWILGYQIPSVREATSIDGRIGRDVHLHYTSLIGTGGMIARAYSPITHEWTLEANRRLDYYADLLERAPGNVWGDNDGYPIPWTTLASQILEPLCLKYLPHVRINNDVKPQLWGHR